MNFQHEQTAGATLGSARRVLQATALCFTALVFFGCASAPKVVTVRQELNASPPGPGEQSQSGARDAAPAGNSSELKKDAGSMETTASPTTLAVAQSSVAKNGQDEKVESSPSATSGNSAQEQAEEELRAKVLQEVKASLMENIKNQIQSEVTASVQKYLQGYEAQMKADMHNDTLQELSGLRQYLEMFRFSGDIRLRYEDDRYGSNNYNQITQISQGVDTQTLLNTWADEEYLKYRIRFNVTAKVNEKVDVIVGLSTGSTTNPVSTNATMDNYMNRDSVVFDLAYLSWRPQENLTLLGGRFPNPFFHTDLVWSPNLNFEGLAAKGEKHIADLASSYLTVGAFPLQQSNPVSIDDYGQHAKWLYAGQVGLERKDQTGVSANIGVAYYYYDNISGVLNNNPSTPDATDWSSPLFTQKGNSIFYIDPYNSSNYRIGLAAKFKELNLTGSLDIGFWDPVHVVFLGDYVTNLGFDQAEVYTLVGASNYVKSIDGYQAGLSVGYPETVKAGAWKVFFYAKRLGNDAVVDAYTDTDFHLGGTNAQGWIAGLDVGLMRNFWLETRWLTADQINGPTLAIDVWQVDLNAKF